MIYLRSTLFALGYLPSVLILGTQSLLIAFLPYRVRYWATGWWAHFVLFWVKFTCGLNYKIEGLPNLEGKVGIILVNHQSAWETILVRAIFPRQTWVLKRSLMWIPFVGWTLSILRPIAINRAKGREALKYLVKEGKQRLENEGSWVLIFPEGTRQPYGTLGEFKIGGAFLASQAGVLVVAVAHDAGKFWPRNAFLKKPGTITVRISEPKDVTGMTAAQINEWSRNWIEQHIP